MPTQYIKRRSSTFPATAKPHASPIYVDSDTNVLTLTPAASGTTEVTIPDSGSNAFQKSQTITAASISANQMNLQSSITLTPTTTFTAGSSLLTPLRGDITLSAGKELDGGFIYGVSGRITATTGTIGDGATALRVVGVSGKVDLGTTTVTTGAAQVSGVWADLAGSPTNHVEVNVLRVTNSMGVNANALGYFSGSADYLFELANMAAAVFATGGAGTIGANPYKIKILTPQGAKYIICADDWS